MSEFNPKQHRTQDRKAKVKTLSFSDAVSPLAQEIKDPKGTQETFKKWPLIPFAGTLEESNHALLAFLNSAKFISPTQGACHESIKTYVFNSKLEIGRLEDPDFNLEDSIVDIPLDTKKAFRDFIRENVLLEDNLTYTQIVKNLFDSFKSNGNYFIELVLTTTAGVKQAFIYQHNTETCAYWATARNEPKLIVISPQFDDEYLRKNQPAIVPVFPNYSENKNVFRTIIHIKNGAFKWYGRPDWVAAKANVYREWQDADYTMKMAANQWTGHVFIEVEEDDVDPEPFGLETGAGTPDSGDTFQTVSERIDLNFTMKAEDPQTALITSRPYGAKPAFVHQFKPVTNEKFFIASSAEHRQKIIENNQWSERLLGNSIAQGFSHDAFQSELDTKEKSVLSSYRTISVLGLNIALTEVMKWFGKTEFESLGLHLKSTTNNSDLETETKKHGTENIDDSVGSDKKLTSEE